MLLHLYKKAVRVIALSAFCALPLMLFAQTSRIEKLRTLLYQQNNDKLKLDLLLGLCNEQASLSADSLLKYINMADKLVKKNTPEYFLVQSYKGIYLTRIGDLSKAILKLTETLEAIPVRNPLFFNAYMQALNMQGICQVRNSENKAAMENAFLLLKSAEEHHSDYWAARANLLLGYANMELLRYDEAIKYCKKCIGLLSSDSIRNANLYAFSNLASCFNNIGEMDSAFHYINLALKYGYADENLSLLANALNIRADMYVHQKQPKLAADDLKEALRLRKLTGDPVFIISDMGQLAFFYASIGDTKKGIETAKEGLAMAEGKNIVQKKLYLLSALAENYRVAGMKDEYAHTLEKILALKDTLFQKNTADAIANIEARYQLQKKENVILQKDAQLIKNRYINTIVIILIIVVFLVIGLVLRNRQLVKNRIMEQKLMEQRIKAREEIKLAQEYERRRIAADLHDNLGAYAAAITNNVKQLKEKSADENSITENLEDNAQQMVTQLSDTIWVLKNENLTLIDLSDRFKLWMQRLMNSYPDIKYYFSEQVEKEINITPANILHLFYILKECVNNAVRHSGCTSLYITFESKEKAIISVADDGHGMDWSKLTGNGITHIKQRVDICKWSVEWQPMTPHGTHVVLTSTT